MELLGGRGWGLPAWRSFPRAGLAWGCLHHVAYLLVFSVFLRRMDPKVRFHALVRVPEDEEKGS